MWRSWDLRCEQKEDKLGSSAAGTGDGDGKNIVSREIHEETGTEEGVHTVMENKAEPVTSGDNGEL